MTEQPGAEPPKYGERRPRPQYGEYATPQEQAKIIAQSLPAVSPLLVPPVDGRPSAAGAPQPPDATTRVIGPVPAAGRRPRRWDIVLTAVLLGYATINVIAQLLTKDTLATIVTQFFISQNIGQYVPTALTASLGETLNVITLGLFVLTVLVTTWMLRRRRVAFWVPIAGGVTATVVALVFVVILLQSDPAFIAYMDRSGK
ncbi:hypothetical protein F1C58_12165 [Glaciihabitans sp. INWT7]|uniref:DUF6264 family protein n=1 Tax=Glaciihabitans sp. INWT7 TaxID=2596912 RepID=UPI00162416A4|nr:DUF6264 family protein [Glaciihabitans sp. INWT7]QNE47581.1 hypothetical protein F1C58_12165 [Glaciihabitans sp. INWT7]